MSVVEGLAEHMPLAQACAAMGVARARVYRARRETGRVRSPRRPSRPERALSPAERDHIWRVLCRKAYVDLTPRAAYAKLLLKGVYLCHWRTMYRILAEHGEVRERRAVRPPRAFVRPELVATGPNQVWSWDITKLKGPVKGQFFYLYVVLDVFSRYVVGWMVADREGADLACQLMAQTAHKHGIQADCLTLHADRGSPMIATALGDLLASLGIAKSHSRPRVSNDNPYSEAQLKTLKYRPAFPDRFRDQTHATHWARETLTWYNNEHAHSRLALLTPATVHAGEAATVLAQRQEVLDKAFAAHPERFPRGRPSAGRLPEAVWINEPAIAVVDPDPGTPVPEAPLPVTKPSAQPVSRAAAGRAKRSLDTGEHSATARIPMTQELAIAQ